MIVKITRFLVLLTVGAVLLSGCATQETAPSTTEVFSEPVYEWGSVTGETLTIWGDRDELNRSYLQRGFQRYEELTGNTLELVPLTKQEIDQKVPEVFNTEDAERPDLLLSYGGANIVNLNPDESFYDFTDAIWIDDLSDTSLNQMIVNGKVMGLPCGEASTSGILYNKSVFQKYGITVPTTQAEFMDACQKLLDQGITPLYLPYAEITMLLYQFPMDSFLQDTATLDALNNGTLSYAQIPEMRSIVQWYKTMADRGFFGESYEQNNWDGMDPALKDGQYAMMLGWDTWLYTNYTGDPSNIGLMPAFVGTPEEGCFEGPNTCMLLVNKRGEKVDAALDFISFMADPYNYNVAIKDVYTAPIFNNQVGSIATPQYLESERLINQKFYDSTAWLRVQGFSQIDAQYIQNYMQGTCTLDQCLQDMDAARIARAAGAPL